MSKNKYSHGKHMAEISKITTLYDVMIMIKKKIAKQEIILKQLDKPGYNKLNIGADILDHLIEQTKSTKDIMENTEMGKTLKAIGTE